MACYALAVAAWLLRRYQVALWAWTAGAVCFAFHVAAAFSAVHHWSHDSASAETARQTLASSGVDSDFGLWLNYLFTAVWIVDAAALWVVRRWPRPRWVAWLLYGFMLFMVFNGAIVFAHGPMRPASIAVFSGLVLLALFGPRGAMRPHSH